MQAEKRLMLFSADVSPLSDKERFEEAYALVSPARREKTDRYRFARDKRLSLGAELLLRYACRAFGLSFDRERVIAREGEKPRLESGRAEFNLSHSGEKVLCALSDLPVGCDVQQTEPVRADIAKRFFHPEEYGALCACRTEEERTELFYRFWTLKESFIKCTGQGLSLPLDSFCLSVSPGKVLIRQSLDGGDYLFFEDGPGDGCRYACCVRAPESGADPAVPVWHRAELSELLQETGR